jgi:UDP-arabinose 4-epimerase
MRRILVTGGAGYVGSHCCKALAEAGLEPIVFDSLSTGHRDAVCWGDLIAADMRDREALRDALRSTAPRGGDPFRRAFAGGRIDRRA